MPRAGRVGLGAAGALASPHPAHIRDPMHEGMSGPPTGFCGRTTGEGVTMRLQTLFTITLLTASGCGASFEQLQSRAAFDLECQPQAITA